MDRAGALAAGLDEAPCLINFGGDLVAVGAATDPAPWTVGIESLSPGAAAPFRRIRLARGGLATSGDARRYLVKTAAGWATSWIREPAGRWRMRPVP